MHCTRTIVFLMSLLALTACGSSEPPPAPFAFVYDPGNNLAPATQTAAMTPESLGQLSPAAGGASHENDPGSTEIRDMENRKAIRENHYSRTGLPRSFPSDY